MVSLIAIKFLAYNLLLLYIVLYIYLVTGTLLIWSPFLKSGHVLISEVFLDGSAPNFAYLF